MRFVVTDSGLGGLAICASLERRLRLSPARGAVGLTYVNAWPDEGSGYNDLPGMATRAAVFDRALARMATLAPDIILIACNTLSIVYAHTAFSRTPACRVEGIVDAGAGLFADALAREPRAAIVLLGTRTTIESGVHRDRLVQRGIDAVRVTAVACPGLATAIERDVDGPGIPAFIDACASDVSATAIGGAATDAPVFAGLCCTHYGYIARRIEDGLATRLGRRVIALDPNARMVDALRWPQPPAEAAQGGTTDVDVTVVSKVRLDASARAGIARLVNDVSPATARALVGYTHDPDVF